MFSFVVTVACVAHMSCAVPYGIQRHTFTIDHDESLEKCREYVINEVAKFGIDMKSVKVSCGRVKR